MNKPACRCINKMKQSIRSLDPEAYLSNLSFSLSGESILPPLEYKQRKQKTNGEYGKKVITKCIVYSHCPFCGKKYSIVNSKGEVVG